MPAAISKSVDDVLTETRYTINDFVLPYRFQNVQLLAYLNTGLREMYALRPDLFFGAFQTVGIGTGTLVDNGLPLLSYQTTDLGQNPAVSLTFDDRFGFDALVFYVAGRAELADDEFNDEGRAMTLLTSFRGMLTGKKQ